MQRPAISIVTPSLNQGEFIEETIQSIIEQKDKNLEYIIIDGGSKDVSIDKIKQYENDIDYWVSEDDDGQSHAINKGIKKASGVYGTWINSDDLLIENGYKNIIEAINKWPDVDIFVGDHILYKNETIENNSRYYDDKFSLAHQLSIFPFIQPACFFRIRLFKYLGYLNENIHYVMDVDLFIRIILYGGKVKRIGKPISMLRIHNTAKTFYFSEDWEKEWDKVFCKLVRSICNDQNMIKKIKNLNIRSKKNDTYTVNIKLNQEEVSNTIKLFLIRRIELLFWAKRYKDMFRFICLFQKEFPQWNSIFIKKMKAKALLYKSSFLYYPFIFILIIKRIIIDPSLILSRPPSLFQP